MADLLRPFFDGSYAPHGYCLLWQPALIWTHVTADALIALSYFSIPVALITLVRQRRDIAFGGVFWLFALFILACGATHVMAIWTLWNGSYGIEAMIKVITAIASVVTAVIIWPLIPKAIALPSPDALRVANAELAGMIAERDSALTEIRTQIAQRERVEAALVQSQKLEAIGQLTGGIAHDFNNLLQAVGGNIELIQGHPADPDRVARWSGNAQKAVARGKALTGQLLAFSRTQRLALTAVPLSPLIGDMADLLERTLGPMVTLEIIPPAAGLTVLADATQLELAILNLAINARDAMPQGGMLSIMATARSGRVHPDLAAGDYVEIAVNDTGSGMTAEVLARAVEPFFTTKGVGKGTGLGLSMVFGVTSQSGGALTIASTPGSGTTITLLLRRCAMAVPDGQLPQAAAATAIDLAGCSILIVDDDEAVRQATAELLADAGAAVLQAADGVSGLRRLDEQRIDLLLVDFAMPGMNGADVAETARRTRPALPVLIITGYSDSARLDHVFSDHVTLLQKPFTGEALLDAIRRLLPDDSKARS